MGIFVPRDVVGESSRTFVEFLLEGDVSLPLGGNPVDFRHRNENASKRVVRKSPHFDRVSASGHDQFVGFPRDCHIDIARSKVAFRNPWICT